jgi:pimeloyl-ACP methyl ester carboxylesterase
VGKRAAVIVSGGGSISPFTTPDAACAVGLAAGSTDTALRGALLDAGIETYTAPVMTGPGQASEDPGWAGFAEPPTVLPADMTIDSVGEVEASAAKLARFLRHLHDEHGLSEIDIVAHSLGGVIARSAHMQMAAVATPVRIISLISIGTPWLGSFVRHFDLETMPMPEPAASFAFSLMAHVRRGSGLVAEADAPPVWAAGKEGGLDGLVLTRISGTYFGGVGEPYPHDGMVSCTSALAMHADPLVFPEATCHEVHGVHSISFARVMDLPWERSITWDPAVMDLAVEAVTRV